MKFAKTLKQHSVPEWGDSYIDYKGLKKLIKNATSSPEGSFMRDEVGTLVKRIAKFRFENPYRIVLSADLGNDLPPFVIDVQQRVLEKVEDELKKCTHFFHMKLMEIFNRIQELDNHLQALSEPCFDIEFMELIAKEMVSTEGLLSKGKQGADAPSDRRDTMDVLRETAKADDTEMGRSASLPSASTSVTKRFPSRNSTGAGPEADDPPTPPTLAWETPGTHPSDKFKPKAWTELLHKRRTVYSLSEASKTKAKHANNVALVSLLRSCHYLIKFQQLNKEALRKIIKKMEKNMTFSISDEYLPHRYKEPVFDSNIPQRVALTCERLYGTIAFNGDGKSCRKEIRRLVETEYSKGLSSEWLVAGVLLGMILSMVTAVVIISARALDPGTWMAEYTSHLAVHRSIGLFSVMIILWSINGFLWQSARINWIFILEWNFKCGALDLLISGGALTTLFMMVLLFTLYLVNLDNYGPISLALGLTFLGIFALPVSMKHSLRMWWLHVCKRIFFPVHSVKFADFFIADQLITLGVAIADFSVGVCWMSVDIWTDSSFCVDSSWVIRPTVAALPPLSRLIQCIRRYSDSGRVDWNPHLLNAGKYTAGLLASSLSVYHSRSDSNGSMKNVWLAIAIIASLYALVWDLRMDWGLFRVGHFPLRAKTMFRSLVYYIAIANDVVCRWLWILSLVPGGKNDLPREQWITIAACIELWRRFVWNIFRMENEHLNNVGHFREVKAAPLIKFE